MLCLPMTKHGYCVYTQIMKLCKLLTLLSPSRTILCSEFFFSILYTLKKLEIFHKYLETVYCDLIHHFRTLITTLYLTHYLEP